MIDFKQLNYDLIEFPKLEPLNNKSPLSIISALSTGAEHSQRGPSDEIILKFTTVK